jgi:RNA polymerase sigma factor (sigma-70 family)
MTSERHLVSDLEVVAERKEFREKAEAFLDVLTGELRRIYDLYDEGKSQHEIAHMMGVSQDTIHRRLKKIKEDFRSFYEG